MNTQAPKHALVIDDLVIPVRIDPDHEYTLATKEVALGYDVSEANVRKMRERHATELKEGKHFISVTMPAAAITGRSGKINSGGQLRGKGGREVALFVSHRDRLRLFLPHEP